MSRIQKLGEAQIIDGDLLAAVREYVTVKAQIDALEGRQTELKEIIQPILKASGNRMTCGEYQLSLSQCEREIANIENLRKDFDGRTLRRYLKKASYQRLLVKPIGDA